MVGDRRWRQAEDGFLTGLLLRLVCLLGLRRRDVGGDRHDVHPGLPGELTDVDRHSPRVRRRERNVGHEVAAFVEKPDEDTARGYVESGEYSWNSGMFCFAAGAYLEALEQFAPGIAAGSRACWESMDTTEQPISFLLL